MSEETFRWIIAGAVGISTLCILIMAVTAIALFGVISKLRVKTEALIARFTPIVDTTRQLARENAPKISDIATQVREIAINAKGISDVVKDQAHRFAEVGRDIADRTKVQVARVDAAVDETVGQVQSASVNLKAAALKPVREASGVIAGVKAAVATLSNGRKTNVSRVAQDEEMFI